MGRAFEVRKASMMKTAAAKAKVYSRFGKEIYVAAKAGVPDPEMNTGLKRVIERAKANQVPADVIKRAIEKAKGGAGENYASVAYELIANGGATLIVDCLTDNTNRTIADIRAAINKSKAKLGVEGSVKHGYDSVGMLAFAFEDEDRMLDILIMADVDVKEVEVEEGIMSVNVEPSDLYNAKNAIEAELGEITFDVLEQTMIANDYITLEGDDLVLFERLTGLLDEIDDVQNVYHNVEL
ncbi:MAG: YebC/PmpR family DNA-binding transcriptional regulator [Erysipelotrichaceae bacterium]